MTIKDKILVIEDEQNISNFISAILTANGYDVLVARNGTIAETMIASHCPDIIILDLGLPDMDGMQILRRVRAWSKIPIVVVSARSHEQDKVAALDAGADDYLTKPFDKSELLARIQAVVRRSKGHSNSVIRTGNVEVNLDTQTVTVGTKTLHLTGKEYGIMELLSLRKGSTLNKDQFLNHLYGGIDEPELKIIDVFICKLRKKLEKASGGKNYIETVWGRGYVLRDPDEVKK